MLTPASLRCALGALLSVTALTLSLSVGSPANAVDGPIISPGLPADTSTDVTPVAAPADFLAATGTAPLPSPIGFGAATTGGAGGRVLHVTTATDSVASPVQGSLRWAVRQPGPKWIVFDSDLTIALSAPLPLTSDTTVDGRGRQVMITGHGIAGIEIHDVSNVVLENLTLHDFGDTSQTSANDPDDAISIERASRVWIDHCSLSMAGDKLIGVADGVPQMTLTWNHFSQQQQTVQIGSVSTANRDIDSTVTLAYNHFDHVGYRTPVVSYGKAHIFNNYMDTWSVSGVRSERLAQVYLENNVFQAGSALKATMVSPAQICNDSGTWCDSRSGFLLDTGNAFLGKTKVVSTGSTHMFNPALAYSYTAQPATASLAATIATGAGATIRVTAAAPLDPNPVGQVTTPAAAPRTTVRAKNARSGTDRLKVSTSGAQTAGLAATVYRQVGSSGWAAVKAVRLDRRGRAHLSLLDRAPGTVARYRVEVAASDTTEESRSNVVSVR
jgi:pectate lyase